MDSEVWKHLLDHEEILRLVLARLSWETNRRLRSVCKAWNATLSEPNFLTWAAMLTDRSFYSDHRNLKWKDDSATTSAQADSSQTDSEHPNGSPAEPVCLLSITKEACAVANFDLHRWFKLPPLQQPPFGRWDDFTVSGAAEGLLLLEGKVRDRTRDLYNLHRCLANPLTNEYVTLPLVPKTEHSFDRHGRSSDHGTLRRPMILSVGRFVKVIAMEFCYSGGAWLDGKQLRRILIWRQNALGWESFRIDAYGAIRMNPIKSVEHAVFAGGELFLHTHYERFGTQGHRVIKCGLQRATSVEVNMDFIDRYYVRIPILHLFQHQGVLMCVIGTLKSNVFEQHRLIQFIKLCKFDHANEKWLDESVIDMPEWMMRKLYDTLSDGEVWRFYCDLEGDTLCIGNRTRAQVFFLYNLVSDEWCASSAIAYPGQNEINQKVFLLSPRRDNGALLQI